MKTNHFPQNMGGRTGTPSGTTSSSCLRPPSMFLDSYENDDVLEAELIMVRKKKRTEIEEFVWPEQNETRLTSNCEVCGIDLPFVHIDGEDEHAYCPTHQREIRKQELLEEDTSEYFEEDADE